MRSVAVGVTPTINPILAVAESWPAVEWIRIAGCSYVPMDLGNPSNYLGVHPSVDTLQGVTPVDVLAVCSGSLGSVGVGRVVHVRSLSVGGFKSDL